MPILTWLDISTVIVVLAIVAVAAVMRQRLGGRAGRERGQAE
jgi:hypothetical protein